jgi:pimeloyl-ACP methyl ester carboxylesterase
MSWKKLHLARRPGGSSIPMMIFHDQGDLKVPPRHGRAIADTWPGCDLVTTRGLGHHKILRDPQVVSRSVDFFRQLLGSAPLRPEAVPAALRPAALRIA